MSKRIISILILVAMLLTACSQTSDTQGDAELEQDHGIYDLPDENVPTDGGEGDLQAESTGETVNNETQNDTDANAGETATEPTEDVQENTEMSNGQPEPTESVNEQTGSESNQPTEPQEIIKKVDPEQLAALTLFALSMEYPDFMLQGFYAIDGENKGIYAKFESMGSELIAHIYPIAKERSEAGTMDIYSNEVGFAAFDLIDNTTGNYDEISEEEYAALLAELSGVSVFSH